MTSRRAASFQKCKFNTKHTIYSTLSICRWSHGVTWCEFAGQSSPSLNFGMQRNAKLFAQACVSGLTHSHSYVFDFVQRRTDLEARVAACSRGCEVGLFLLPVVMLSRCLNTHITNEVNNMSCNISQMHRRFRNVFITRNTFYILLNKGPSAYLQFINIHFLQHYPNYIICFVILTSQL